jgi:hypothetical protein
MVIFFVRSLQAWLEGLKQDEQLSPILLGVCAALIGAMTAGIVDHYFFNLDFPHSVTLFWIFVGLGVTTILLAGRPLPARGARAASFHGQ